MVLSTQIICTELKPQNLVYWHLPLYPLLLLRINPELYKRANPLMGHFKSNSILLYLSNMGKKGCNLWMHKAHWISHMSRSISSCNAIDLDYKMVHISLSLFMDSSEVTYITLSFINRLFLFYVSKLQNYEDFAGWNLLRALSAESSSVVS